MDLFKPRRFDSIYLIGLSFLAASLLVFCLPLVQSRQPSGDGGVFMLNFLLAAGFLILLFLSRISSKRRVTIHHKTILLLLMLVSCYALNREMSIFEASVPWFSTLLVISSVNLLLFVYFDQCPRPIQVLMLTILGISFAAFVYLALYLVPLYAISLFVFWVLGISLHSFVPLLFCILSIVLLLQSTHRTKAMRWYFVAGLAASTLLVIVYSIQWGIVTSQANKLYRNENISMGDGLPAWVGVAQKIPHNGMLRKALESGLVYSAPSNHLENLFWRMPARNFGESLLHDPLVMTASFFSGPLHIPELERISILGASYNERHESEERLWSGKDLQTTKVETSVRIWPQYCMSYTEKTLTVSNMDAYSEWNNQQEALYTFILPEGAVVTALSLWIDGKETRGMLTSKEKAASAYRSIVGYECRDPSVVHWQEGNTVTVRVFPVIAGQSRRFRIGITAPLTRNYGKMMYENVWFKGPVSSDAQEDLRLDFEQEAKGLVIPASFGLKENNAIRWSGRYRPRWTIQMNERPLSTQTFSFDGKVYGIRPYDVQREPDIIQSLYLDIDRSWTWKEYNYLLDHIGQRKAYAYDGHLIELTELNREKTFKDLSSRQFSLFPIFKIEDPSCALLVSKSAGNTPNLADLHSSSFYHELAKYIGRTHDTRLFHIGEGLSPYLKSLKERRAFRYEQGSWDDLMLILREGRFAKNLENDDRIVLEQAGIALTRSYGMAESTAPDHLMRLFTYNHIMQQMGLQPEMDSLVNEKLVSEAQRAYVVSPVSSLVVLESAKDYERFDIDNGQSSLLNASLHSKGAVPEPHEWALVLLVLIILLYLHRRNAFHKIKTQA